MIPGKPNRSCLATRIDETKSIGADHGLFDDGRQRSSVGFGCAELTLAVNIDFLDRSADTAMSTSLPTTDNPNHW